MARFGLAIWHFWYCPSTSTVSQKCQSGINPFEFMSEISIVGPIIGLYRSTPATFGIFATHSTTTVSLDFANRAQKRFRLS